MNDISEARFKEAFLIIDENNTGAITVSDVHFLIRALGFTPTENDFAKIDLEFIHNRNIDYLWFIELVSTMSCTKYSYEQIQEAFYSFDKNRYGLINVETFKTAMTTMGEPLSDSEMKEMMKDIPIDEDGFIEYEHYLMHLKPKESISPLPNKIDEKQ
ncbi:unnamed protein product [Rotaria magnacalcarata]|uniref:EF-hand domain-containing protein n=1 Tax=Rotaria magnacalcarata TaxID=392030 RepID=A0A816LXI7_9BILA|nr:unnamed protein product [Rotaria magnacalcarata]CAF3863503.1 unnamed protein product [Rotaria magnacalcarata]